MAIEPEDRFYMNFGRYLTSRAEDATNGDGKPITTDTVRHMEIDWWTLKTGCQSPIELLLASELLFLVDGYNEVCGDSDVPPKEIDFGTVVSSQGMVCGYAADFAFKLIFKGAVAHTVVVECDGHDFHERTKEQAKRDRSRDRKMTTAGITVLRFTGSEIYRDPQKCAEEIQSVLEQKMCGIVEPRK